MSDRELVRCGCGVVRNDEDRPCWPLQGMAVRPVTVPEGERLRGGYELPRLCRGCGCIYALPKQSPPA